MSKRLPQQHPIDNFSKKLQNNIEQGKSLLKEGKYSEAEKYLFLAVKLDANSEPAHFELGKTYYMQSKLQKSEKEFKKALKINKDNRDAGLLLAKIYRSSNKYVPALDIFLKLITRDNDNKELYSEIEAVYEDSRDYDAVINGYRQALARGVNDAWVHVALAKVYKIKGEHKDTVKEYEQAIAKGADSKELRLELAESYKWQEEYGNAIKEYKEAIKRGADNVGVQLEIAHAYYNDQQYELAQEQFKNIQKTSPSIDIQQMLIEVSKKLNKEPELEYVKKDGAVSISKEEQDDAIKEYRQAQEKGADVTNAQLKLAELYYRHKQYKLALEEYIKIQGSAPSLQTLSIIIKLYKKLKNFDMCIETGNEYIKRENEEDVKYNKKLIETFRSGGKNKGIDKELKVKIIRTPCFDKKPKDEMDHCLLLPIGLGRIVSYLKSNGIKIDQDDLYIKVNHDNMFAKEKDKIDREVFFDEKRIIEYSESKDDEYIDSILKKIEKKTKLKGYKIILISLAPIAANPSGHMFALAFARYLKKKYGPFIIAGGLDNIVNDMMKYNSKNIDLIIKGKGEKPLFIVLNAIKHGIDMEKIPDISIGNNGKLITTNLHTKLDIIPDFSGLSMGLYRYRNRRQLDDEHDKEKKKAINGFNKSKLLVSPYVIMEGCSHECAFCGDSNLSTIFALTPKRVVEHLRCFKEKYGVKCFFFLDDTLNLSKEYINELCDEIIKSGLDILWSDCARADNLDRETLFKMRKAGCIRLIYGMETASQRLLHYVDKEINLKRLENILTWTDEAGIWTGIEIICGFPHETKRDLQLTVDFLNKNRKYINWIYCNIFHLLPLSKMNVDHDKYGIENVVDIDTAKYEREELKNMEGLAFDEAGGLRWKDKLKQMTEGYDYVVNRTIKHNSPFQSYEMEHLLFYLYSKYKNKKEILRIFNKIRAPRFEKTTSNL